MNEKGMVQINPIPRGDDADQDNAALKANESNYSQEIAAGNGE
ncbi:hypothetical protein AQUSIP_10070 [Aquicella siphonis]|uniref:Uncharacterized protein n=1 Tax=Aquicella siphonis TaxID=254247 RepID=A0A5E4PGY3_9COXI|nr:hypothetical protein [Aquicella siphonis]VVC75717.1 hypothetical protein AQUSIP_10070 [Aquicella siphonis]